MPLSSAYGEIPSKVIGARLRGPIKRKTRETAIWGGGNSILATL
jgi:hypothetical protein